MYENFDAIVGRLVNLPSWNVYKFDEKTKKVEPYFQVTGAVIHDLVIKDHNVRLQAQVVLGQIAHWGRWTAQCKRVWEVVEHQYRIWRDGKALELTNPEGKPDGWKKPTVAQVDQLVRTDPEYEDWYIQQERAEEAFNSSEAVYEAFKLKAKLLQSAVFTQWENSVPTYGI